MLAIIIREISDWRKDNKTASHAEAVLAGTRKTTKAT
jgi:hypothetical protein